MFPCESCLYNGHIVFDNAEILGVGLESCLVHTGIIIFFLIQFYSLMGLYFCLLTTKQVVGNHGFETKDSKIILVHHVVDHEAVSSRGYVHQVKKSVQLKTN